MSRSVAFGNIFVRSPNIGETASPGNEVNAEIDQMAIVTIGGLVYGTLLTLFVVPCIYDLLNRKKDMREKTVDEESMIEEAMDEKE